MTHLDNRPLAIQHNWVTVVNPINHQMLLQACDDCGVVKSENSVIRNCRAGKGRALISKASQSNLQLVG